MRKHDLTRTTASAGFISSWLALTLGFFLVAESSPAAALQAWLQRHHSPMDEAVFARVVAFDPAGNVVMSGASYCAKYAAADGTLLWQRNLTNYAKGNTAALRMAVDAAGDVLVTGFADGGANGYDFYTAKYAGVNGFVLWERYYDGPAQGHDFAWALAVDGAGHVIVSGESMNATNADFFAVKYSGSNGATLWERRASGSEGSEDSLWAVAVDGAGDVFVIGSSTTTDADYYTAKYSGTNGAVLWARSYDDPLHGDDRASGLAIDSHGDVIVTGDSNDDSEGRSDYYTIKYSGTDGAVLWEKRYNGPDNQNDLASAVVIDRHGDAVITGMSADAEGVGGFATLKYAGTNGAMVWERRRAAQYEDFPHAMKLDPQGNVVISGRSLNENDSDIYTVKYAATNGVVLWEKRYAGPAGGSDLVDSPDALAVGTDGTVAIAGASDGDETLFDYIAIVYRENLPPLSIEALPAGALLRFPCVAGQSYRIERASAVAGPWSTNATFTALTNGPVQFLDTNAPAGSAFYRTSAN